MYDYTYDQWPFYKASPEKYPTRQQQVRADISTALYKGLKAVRSDASSGSVICSWLIESCHVMSNSLDVTSLTLCDAS